MRLDELAIPWGPIFEAKEPYHEDSDSQLQGQIGQEIRNVMARQNLGEKNKSPNCPRCSKGQINKQAKAPVGGGGFGL